MYENNVWVKSSEACAFGQEKKMHGRSQEEMVFLGLFFVMYTGVFKCKVPCSEVFKEGGGNGINNFVMSISAKIINVLISTT